MNQTLALVLLGAVDILGFVIMVSIFIYKIAKLDEEE